MLSFCAFRPLENPTISVCEWFCQPVSCVEHIWVHEPLMDPGKSGLQCRTSSSGTISQLQKLINVIIKLLLFFFLLIIVLPQSLFYKPTVAVVIWASLWMTSTLWGMSLAMKSPQPPLPILPPRPAPRRLLWTALLNMVKLILKCKMAFW